MADGCPHSGLPYVVLPKLKHFSEKQALFMRVVLKKSTKGSLQERVLIVRWDAVLLCEIKNPPKVKRQAPVSAVGTLVFYDDPQAIRHTLIKFNETADMQDLLFLQGNDPRNESSDQRDFERVMMKLAELQVPNMQVFNVTTEAELEQMSALKRTQDEEGGSPLRRVFSSFRSNSSHSPSSSARGNSTRKSLPPLSPTSDVSARMARGKSAPPGGSLRDGGVDTAFGSMLPDSPNGSFSSFQSGAQRSMSVINEAQLPPLARVPPALKGFSDGGSRIFFISIVEKRSAKGKWQKRVIVVTHNAIVLAELNRQVKRHIGFRKIGVVKYQAVQDDNNRKSETVYQFLMKVPEDGTDLLWAQTYDSRNDKTLGKSAFLEVLSQVMAARGLRLQAEKVSGQDLDDEASLKKGAAYVKPLQQLKEVKKELKRADSWSASGSPTSKRSSSWFGGGSRRESLAPTDDDLRNRSKSHSPTQSNGTASPPATPAALPQSPLEADNLLSALASIHSQRDWDVLQQKFYDARGYSLPQGMRDHLSPAVLQQCIDLLLSRNAAFERHASAPSGLDSPMGSAASVSPAAASPKMSPSEVPPPEQRLEDSVLQEASGTFPPVHSSEELQSAAAQWFGRRVPLVHVSPVRKAPWEGDPAAADRILVVTLEHLCLADKRYNLKHAVPLDTISAITYSGGAEPVYLLVSLALRLELCFKISSDPPVDLASFLHNIRNFRSLSYDVTLAASASAVLNARQIPTLSEANLKENAKASPLLTPKELPPAEGEVDMEHIARIIPPALITDNMRSVIEAWFGQGVPALHTQVVDRVNSDGDRARRVFLILPEYVTLCDFQRNFKQALPLSAIKELHRSSDAEPLIQLVAPSLDAKIQFIAVDHERNRGTSPDQLITLLQKLFIARGLPLSVNQPLRDSVDETGARTVLVTPAHFKEEGPPSPVLAPASLPASSSPGPAETEKVHAMFDPIAMSEHMKLVTATWFGPHVQVLKLLYVERITLEGHRATRVFGVTPEHMMMLDVERNMKRVLPLPYATRMVVTREDEPTYLILADPSIPASASCTEICFVAIKDLNNGEVPRDYATELLQKLYGTRDLPLEIITVDTLAELQAFRGRASPAGAPAPEEEPIRSRSGRSASLAPLAVDGVCSVTGMPTGECPEAFRGCVIPSDELLFVRAVQTAEEPPSQGVLSITHDRILFSPDPGCNRAAVTLAARDLTAMHIGEQSGIPCVYLTAYPSESLRVLLGDDSRNDPAACPTPLSELIRELVSFHGLQGFEEVAEAQRRPAQLALPQQGQLLSVEDGGASPAPSPPVSPMSVSGVGCSLPPGVEPASIPSEFAYLVDKVPSHDPVLFLRVVEKVSSHGHRQKRVLLLTPSRLVLWDERSMQIKRYIDLKLITDMIIQKNTERRGILSSKEDAVYHILLRVPGEQLDLLFVQSYDGRNSSHDQDAFPSLLKQVVASLGSKMDHDIVSGTEGLVDLAQLVKADTYRSPEDCLREKLREQQGSPSPSHRSPSGARVRTHSETDSQGRTQGSLPAAVPQSAFPVGTPQESPLRRDSQVGELRQQLAACREELQRVKADNTQLGSRLEASEERCRAAEAAAVGGGPPHDGEQQQQQQVEKLLRDLHAERQRCTELQTLMDHLHAEALDARAGGGPDPLEVERLRARVAALEKEKLSLESRLAAAAAAATSADAPAAAPGHFDPAFAEVLRAAGVEAGEADALRALRVTQAAHLQDVTGGELKAALPGPIARRLLRTAGYREGASDNHCCEAGMGSPGGAASPSASSSRGDGKLAQKLRVAHDVNKAQRETITILREQIKVLKSLHSPPGRFPMVGGPSPPPFGEQPPSAGDPFSVGPASARQAAVPPAAAAAAPVPVPPPSVEPAAAPAAAPLPQHAAVPPAAVRAARVPDVPQEKEEVPAVQERAAPPAEPAVVVAEEVVAAVAAALPPVAEPPIVQPSPTPAAAGGEVDSDRENSVAPVRFEATPTLPGLQGFEEPPAVPQLEPRSAAMAEPESEPEPQPISPVSPEAAYEMEASSSTSSSSFPVIRELPTPGIQDVVREVVEIHQATHVEAVPEAAPAVAPAVQAEEEEDVPQQQQCNAAEGDDVAAPSVGAAVVREESAAPEREVECVGNVLPTPASSVCNDEGITRVDTPEARPQEAEPQVVESLNGNAVDGYAPAEPSEASSDARLGGDMSVGLGNDLPFVGSPVCTRSDAILPLRSKSAPHPPHLLTSSTDTQPAGMMGIKPGTFVDSSDDDSS